ncbi:MAG: helicase C-terminal domain-containing protein [Clostridiales bacterium]|uniref:helicase C-terminal domain-containing protein n=1 Tax=Terrisporobacter sp. TaxID=1965305 RepID=UPI002A56085D|nr:helicase C-terminal domain-containing protein [Terrisporobacter sp.]MDD7755779.1 helicase C-terminal domain-containing protein [Clostridiales bacterium]MDY4135896.1 helicase C-terminal domain-containing protein [Terrisporobacter sp.]
MDINKIKSIVQDVVFIDLETSGLNPHNSEILEIGAIKSENNKLTSFHTFVKNKREIPLEIFSLCTDLKQSDLDNAPTLCEIKKKLIDFLGDKKIICHNGEFERAFLNHFIPEIKNEILDSMELMVILEPYHKEYNLEYLKNTLTKDKSIEKHRAIDDVVDTINIINAVLMRLKDKESKAMTLENLTFKINSTLNRFGLNKWIWSELIDNGNYNIDNIDVIYEDEKYKNENKRDLKNTLIDHRFSYEHLLKKKEIWQSKKGFNYEFRPGQFELSKIIRETMNTRSENIACIEAPTGIGKSVGYLLPSIMESYLNNKRIIISTDTKELQTQLIKKDIPNVIKSLGLEDKISFGYIKGKSNYICVEKLEKYINEYDNDKCTTSEILSLIILERLVSEGIYGDIEEINYWIFNNFPEIITHLRHVACDPNLCKPKKCYKECLYKKRVEELKEEDITVVNHSLLARWPYKDEKPIENLIVDEAHNLVEKGYEFFASEVEYRSLKFFLHEIYPYEMINNSPFAYTTRNKKIIKPFDRFYYFLNMDANNKSKISRKINLIIEEAEYILEYGRQNNYSTISNYNLSWEINLQKNEKAGSVYKDKRMIDVTYDKYGECIKNSLDKILANLKSILYILDRHMDDDSIDKENDTYKQGESKFKDLDALKNTIEVFLEYNEADTYARIVTLSKNFDDFLFQVIPLNIADLFEEKILSSLSSGIFLSATLTVNNKMRHFTNTLGIDRFIHREEVIEPIFDYKNRIKIITLDDISSYKNKEFISDMSKVISNLSPHTNGHMLSLFNSKDRQEKTYEVLKDYLHKQNTEIYMSKKYIKILKDLNKKCVILGSKGCFEGVDIPGDGLICVTLDKIPNLNPKDPLYSTIMAKFNKTYYDINQPQMIIKLKQAMGRILRSKYDYGCFIIFDMGRKENLYRLKKDLHNCQIVNTDQYNIPYVINNHLTSCRKEIIRDLIHDISDGEVIRNMSDMKDIEEYINEEINNRSINANIKVNSEKNYLLKYFDLKYLINKEIIRKN